jgi:EmrB/QacA subfamily drug resistance transporter
MLKSIIAGPDQALAGNAPNVTLAPPVRWALASLSLSMLLSSLGTSIANVGLPTLAQAFEASFQQVQWVVLAYLLAITTLIVSVGRLGDLTGRRRLLLAGLVLFTLASILCGLAPTLGLLIAARAAQGLGAAIMMALTMAFVSETVPKAKTGSAMGLLGTMSAIGTALGPSLGGVLIAGLGWRAIFFVNVPLGILTFVLAYRYLPVDRRESKTDGAGFDPMGTLLLALTLAAYALAVTMGHGSFGPLNLALLLAAVLGAALFVLAQARAASPLIRLAMFRDPGLSASLAMNALVSTVMMATLVVGPFYLSRALQLTAAHVGIVMAIGPIISTLSGVPAGRLVDRLGARFMVIVGLIAMAGGSMALSLLPALFGTAGYVAAIAILTPGYQLFQAANNTAVMADIRPDQRGVISGLLNLSRNLGLVSGASVMGAVFAFASATADIATAQPEALAAGMRITFAVAAILVVVALAIALASRAHARQRSKGCINRIDNRPTPGHSSSRGFMVNPRLRRPSMLTRWLTRTLGTLGLPSTSKEIVMPKYVIERSIPGIGAAKAAELQAISQKSCSVLQELGPDVQWMHSYVTGDKVYCVYHAKNEELVREHARRGGFPADSVARVMAVIDPATAET